LRSFYRAILVLLCALAVAGGASASPPPAQLAAQTNYTQAERLPDQIRFVVIHVSEGSFFGTVAWLRDPRAHASANFVVSRTGRVDELVPLHDIAWQAGNWAYNLRSVGIENVGYTGDPAGFSLPEYRATARLTATIARRSLIPIDRQHIIGHYQVPDPNDPLQGGGIDNHTDPGKYWNWRLFMRLVRNDAYPQRLVKHKHVGLVIESSTLTNRQVVAGQVPWRTAIGGPVKHVSFVVDGKVVWTDHVPPYAYGGGKLLLNTVTLRNGKHVLEVRAYGVTSWSRQRFAVRVRNEPFALAPVNLKAKQRVSGVVPVRAMFTGLAPARVLFYLDGRLIERDSSAPYVFRWDTRRTKDGLHVVTLAGRARDGRIVRSHVKVKVANHVFRPAAIVADSLADGQTVSGLQHWLVQTSGSVARVDFVLDGAVVGSSTATPYAFDWNTSVVTPGPHVLGVQAVGKNGATAQQTLTVTVAAPQAGP
jgi:N-acetyl-anhydromuramyl-L-alanine amidase AmpD